MNAKERVLEILEDPKEYIENLVYIKTKDSQVKKLILNPMQEKVYNILQTKRDKYNSIKVIILKSRQHGISTLEGAYGFHDIATHKNRNFAIVTQEEKATKNLFERMKFIYMHLPVELQPTRKYSNANELVFQNDKDPANSLNSKVQCYTAGSQEIGRSETINHLHLSEYAFWSPTFALQNYTAIMQTIPKENSIVVIESTANGFNFFKDLWDNAVAGKNDFIPIFIPWFENPEYSIDGVIEDKTSEEIQIQKLYNLTDQQLIWRRWCISNNCNNDLDMFHQEYPSSPEEAFVTSGHSVFNNKIITQRIQILEKLYSVKQPKKGCFFDGKFVEGVRNYITIYKKPIKDHAYVLGLDTKGEGHDKYSATVIDNTTGDRVATFWGDVPANEVVDQIEALGYFYNTALISVEINFNSYPIEELEKRCYPYQYVRRVYDNYTGIFKKAFGWKTDGNTRPLMITYEQILINEHIELFNDINMLRECLTFVYDDNGRPDAMSGKHDDTIFSDMIANMAREQQDIKIKTEKEKPKIKIHESIKKDYYNADEATQAKMREIYGDVF